MQCAPSRDVHVGLATKQKKVCFVEKKQRKRLGASSLRRQASSPVSPLLTRDSSPPPPLTPADSGESRRQVADWRPPLSLLLPPIPPDPASRARCRPSAIARVSGAASPPSPLPLPSSRRWACTTWTSWSRRNQSRSRPGSEMMSSRPRGGHGRSIPQWNPFSLCVCVLD